MESQVSSIHSSSIYWCARYSKNTLPWIAFWVTYWMSYSDNIYQWAILLVQSSFYKMYLMGSILDINIVVWKIMYCLRRRRVHASAQQVFLARSTRFHIQWTSCSASKYHSLFYLSHHVSPVHIPWIHRVLSNTQWEAFLALVALRLVNLADTVWFYQMHYGNHSST